MHVEKTEVMRTSRQPSAVQIMIDQKQLEDVGYFNCLCRMITNDAKCTREIKSRCNVAKAATTVLWKVRTATQLYPPEDSNPQQYHSESLKCSIL